MATASSSSTPRRIRRFLELRFSRRRRINVLSLPGNFGRYLPGNCGWFPITISWLEGRFGALIDQNLLSMVQIGSLFFYARFVPQAQRRLKSPGALAGPDALRRGAEVLVWFVQPEAPRRARAGEPRVLSWKIAS